MKQEQKQQIITAAIFGCNSNLQKVLEKYFTLTLRNKSFSLAVASLECMKLFKAVFAAVNRKQKNLLFVQSRNI